MHMSNTQNNSKKREILTEITKYLAIFLAFYVFSKGNIAGIIYPFTFGLLFALMWCDHKVYILAPLYVVANFLGTFDLFALYGAVATAAVLVIVYYIHLKAKKRFNYVFLGIYALVSQVTYLCLEIILKNNIIAPIISVLLGVMFMFACVRFFEAIIVRGFAYRLSVDEIICAGIILAGFSSGVCAFTFGGFELIKFFAVFAILVSCYCFNVSTSLFVGGIMGIGALLAQSNPIYIASFTIWAMAISCFKSVHKIFAAVAVLLVEATLGWYFGIYGSYSIFAYLPVIIASVMFVCIPNKALDEFRGFFSAKTSEIATRNIVNQNREMMSRRLGELSEVFAEMDSSFRSMIKGGLTKEQSVQMLKEEIKDKICIDCPERNKCHRALYEETDRVMSELIATSFERGKATLIDVPPYLTSRCNRVNPMISSINQLSSQYKQYDGLMKNFDASRILIAEQLGGVSKIMKSLAVEVNKNIVFDTVKESKILDELTYQNLVCSDVACFEQNENLTNVTLLIKNEDSKKPKVGESISKVCGCKMMLETLEPSPRSGWSVATFKTAPNYDIIFGTAAAKKATSDISGDSYSLIKIDSDKFMMALCDGMGSGKKAEKTSNLAMGIIENFYKAGFDNDLILSSANKLLSLGNDEMFSALDLCVVDLRKGVADIIKLGAPVGLLKNKKGTQILDSGALPLGVLRETNPSIRKLVLTSSDMLVLATDGVTDSFYSSEDYSNFVNNLDEQNPQKMAEDILKQALKNNGGSALDDMTIIVAKIFKN